jgi:hypothetical protein
MARWYHIGTIDDQQGAWYMELLARHVRLSTYIVLALFYHYTFDMAWVSGWPLRWMSCSVRWLQWEGVCI